MKDDGVYLRHVLRCIARIEEYTAAGREVFFSSQCRTECRSYAGSWNRTRWIRGNPWGLANPGRTYDISPDGQRFLLIKAAGGADQAAPTTLIVVQHFDEELKRLVPTR